MLSPRVLAPFLPFKAIASVLSDGTGGYLLGKVGCGNALLCRVLGHRGFLDFQCVTREHGKRCTSRLEFNKTFLTLGPPLHGLGHYQHVVLLGGRRQSVFRGGGHVSMGRVPTLCELGAGRHQFGVPITAIALLARHLQVPLVRKVSNENGLDKDSFQGAIDGLSCGRHCTPIPYFSFTQPNVQWRPSRIHSCPPAPLPSPPLLLSSSVAENVYFADSWV